ncbi:MAG: YaiO family outer membrane beta-barrel protein [Bacteroidota bacterium]
MRLGVLLALLVASSAMGQPARVDVWAGVQPVSEPFEDGRVLRLAYVTPGPDGGAWRIDADLESRFGERGLGLNIQHTRDLGERWTGAAYAGTGTDNIFLPRFRAGVEAGRKWGNQWVMAAGVGVFDAHDVHRDLLIHAEARRRSEHWMIQGGGRLSVSTPGTEVGGTLSMAVTHISPGGRWVLARVAASHEAWLVTEPVPLQVGFESVEGMVQVRQPVTGGVRVLVGAMHYRNPYYTRSGLEMGLSLDLP